ncbi:MAG: hypothetical protein U5N85_21435 [Arcicella sp.]|nr:hypothetical protein [Arcicella sp.]
MLLINNLNSFNPAFAESKFTFNFRQYFFNNIEHLQNQGGENTLIFYWQNIDNQTIEARLSVIVQNKIACSPLRATFGGIEFSEDITEENLFQFLQESVLKIGLKTIKINSYPEGYLRGFQIQKLENCLFKLGFGISITEQNYEIPITEKSFYETINSIRARQLLRKSIKKEFSFQEIINPNFTEIHAFITHSRERKNRPMTMNLEQFENHFRLFPKNFQVFSVTEFQQTIAVAVTIKINSQIVYTFYLADNEFHLKYSPTVFLLSGIYDYFKSQNYTILDLGIATNKGILNEGLARFKRSLGANSSLKKTYLKIV